MRLLFTCCILAAACLAGCSNPTQPPKMAESEFVGGIHDEIGLNSSEFRVYRIKTPDGWLYITRDGYHGGVTSVMVPTKEGK